jgi:hypothetical protein
MVYVFVVQVKPLRDFVAIHPLVNSIFPPIFYTHKLVESEEHLCHFL